MLRYTYMRAFGLFILLCVSVISYGQQKGPFDLDTTDENYKIVKFVRDHNGKKVGNGVCQTLVTEAYKQKFPHWTDSCSYNLDSLKKHEVTLDKARAGDIIDFHKTKTGEWHTGIIMWVKGPIIWYADQNAAASDTPTKVVPDQGGQTEVFVFSKVQYRMIDVRKRGHTDLWIYHF